MSRIAGVFNQPLKDNKQGVLNIYCTAGFPELNSTVEVMKALEDAGADLIELGMPYSDPLADGPVIQQSGSIALANGMTISKLFEQLKDFRKEVTVPVILMGYMNPVLQFGFEKFCTACAAAGIDGLILPDLPIHEYESIYGKIIKRSGLDFIFLVTPETDDERVRKLDFLSSGFLYAVSASSTTGNSKHLADMTSYLNRLNGLGLKNPILVGFGIRDRKSFENACTHARGAIIGTAYIKALEGATDLKAATRSFISSIFG